MTFRVAHIGAGEWSRYAHGPTLRRLAEQSKVSLEGICDLQFERALQFRDLFQYRLATNNIEELLAKTRPDAIVCTVNPMATAALVRLLLPLAIPLFIEKPPGVSLVEAISLATAATAARAFTFVAFNRRAIPSVVALRSWSAGRSVRFARGEMLRTNRLESGFAVATGIHVLDTIRYFIGDPDRIEVMSRPHANTSACDYSILLSRQNASIAEISLMVNTGQKRESYCLFSEGESAEAILGSAYGAGPDFKGYREWLGETVAKQTPIDTDPLVEGGFIGEYEQFLRLIEKGEASTCSLMDAARSMQLAEAVHKQFSGRLPVLSLG